MDMKLPSAIQIYDEWVKIKYVDEISDSKYEKVWGEYNPINNEITILLDTPEQMFRTLYHELCHCILYKSGWAEKLGMKTEESLCLLFEYFSLIYCLSSNNKKIRWKRNANGSPKKARKKDSLPT